MASPLLDRDRSGERLSSGRAGVIGCKIVRVVGIDEAGYGPWLGPLTVGAVTMETDGAYEPAAIWSALGERWGIADSKKVLGHRAMGAGETTTLAMLAAAGVTARTRRELLDRVLVAPRDLERAAATALWCGAADDFAARACAPDDTPLPRWGEAPSRERVEDLQRRLLAAKCRLVEARVIALCPGRLNASFGRGANKAAVNGDQFVRHLLRVRDWIGPDGLAVCGKLGGRSRYGSVLLDVGLSAPVEEGRARSVYDVAGFGRVEFLRGAEDLHPAVAMASMIAKMVREHLLDQWHGLLAAEVPGLETCSGYHDPVTKRYVEQTAVARRRLGIPDRCFLRER